MAGSEAKAAGPAAPSIRAWSSLPVSRAAAATARRLSSDTDPGDQSVINRLERSFSSAMGAASLV
jgi:hypothetical protein